MLELKDMGFKRFLSQQKILVIAIGLLIVLGLSFVVYRLVQPAYFPSSVTRNVNFSLYYPVNLPAGLSIERSSFASPQSQVITFRINEASSPKYYVSVEAIPNSFDDTVFQRNFIRVEAFKTPTGSGLVGALNNQLVGEVRTTDNTLILIATSDTTAAKQLKTLCQAFQKVH